jgi:hypothetical protein
MVAMKVRILYIYFLFQTNQFHDSEKGILYLQENIYSGNQRHDSCVSKLFITVTKYLRKQLKEERIYFAS